MPVVKSRRVGTRKGIAGKTVHPDSPRNCFFPPGGWRIFLLLLLLGLAPAEMALAEFPSIDASNNNPNGWGVAGTPHIRIAFPAYSDGISAPSGSERPNPREISNAVSAQSGSIRNDRNLSDLIWQWGQFIDHDVALTEAASPREPLDIEILDPDDPLFNPQDPYIHLNRSKYAPESGGDTPRQQVNSITSFVDASMIYGSNDERASALRTFTGGKLKTDADDLLPFNTEGFPNANDTRVFPAEQLRFAGDVRVNEQPGLTAIHTLFVREHNRLASEIAADNPGLSDEEIYQRARTLVRAQVQAITWLEFLPALMGPHAPGLEGRRYNPSTNPSLINEFAGAAFRYGHSQVSPVLQRIGPNGASVSEGGVPLRDGFFNPLIITDSAGLDSLLKGLATQLAQRLDTRVNEEMRNFLFGPPGAGGLDLVALNIQRGRDHGLPDFNTVRQMLGLSRRETFAEITGDSDLQTALGSVYNGPDELDLFIGILAEDHLSESSVGETLATILKIQFSNLMEGDRFFFLWDPNLTEAQRNEIQQTRLSDVILRNTAVTGLRENVFFVPEDRIDSDFDGMPDQWELSFDLDPNNPADAAEDADQDGKSNFQEFLEGSNPRQDENSVELGIEDMGDGRVMLRFPATTNHTYTVYYCEDLSDNEWIKLFDVPKVSEDQMMEMMDEMPTDTTQRFYQLSMEVASD